MKRIFQGSVLRNERGILTLDFIFALIIGMSFTTIFFALTLTLSLVEVAQYFSFSVARVAMAANATPDAQRARATAKYNELRSRPIFRSLFGKGWFILPPTPDFGDVANGFNLEYTSDPNEDNATFYGARLRIQSKILDFKVPMLGNTKTKAETGTANVQTFLSREVTTSECQAGFNRQRWSRILTMPGSGPYSLTPAQAAASVLIMSDNGC